MSVEGPAAGGDGGEWEEDLLFGLYVFLLRYVSSSEFSVGVKAWLADPARPLASHLEDSGALSPEKRAFAERLVLQTIGYCDGDLEEAFRLLGGRGRIQHLLSSLDEQTSKELTTRIAIDLEGFDAAPIEDLFAHREELGRYTRSTEYSRGGMGRIFIVHDELLIRDVALKELLPLSESSAAVTPEESPIRGSGELLARFLKEARITGRLEHPTIVPVYELGRRPSGAPYYTMRLVRGKTLAKALEDCATLEERLRYLPNFIDLCMGIAYAHSKDIIHRDIKPANVMVGEFGETVIIDWGLAKLLGERDEDVEAQLQTVAAMRKISKEAPVSETREGLQIGTPAYMSPEQAAGNIQSLDPRADIFSLGIVLYRILTGQLPFQGKTAEETMALIQKGQFAAPGKVEPHVPRELASICMKALAVDKNKRYASAQQFAEDIRSFLSGSLVGAYNYSPRERFARYYRRNRGILNTAAAALVLVLATGAVSYYNVREARDDAVVARDEAQYNEYLAQMRLAQAYLEDNDYPAVRDILWNTEPALRNWEWGYMTAITHQEKYSIDGPGFMAVSDDGEVFAHWDYESTLQFRNTEDGSLISEAPGLERQVIWAEFRPNSHTFTAALITGTVRTWNVDTGDVLWSMEVTPQKLDAARYSGDGNRFVTMSETGEVILWDYTGSFPNEITRFDARQVGSLRLTWETRVDSDYGYRAQLNETGDLLLLALRDNETSFGEFDLYTVGVNGEEKVGTAEGYYPTFRPGSPEIAAASTQSLLLFPLNADDQLGQPETLGEHQQPITGLAFSPDGNRLVSTSQDGTAMLHHLDSEQAAMSLVRGSDYERVNQAAFSSDGNLLATSTGNARIQIWDVATGSLLNEVRGHTYPPMDLALASEQRLVVSAASDGVKVWNAVNTLGSRVVYRAAGGVADLASEREGKVLALASRGARVALLSVPDHQPQFSVAAFEAFGSPKVILGDDGDRLALILDEFTPVTFDVQNRQLLAAFRGHSAKVLDIDLSDDGDRVITIALDGEAIVWETDSGAELLRVDAHRRGGTAVASFRPDGRGFVTGGFDGDVHLWDDDGTLSASYNTDGPITALLLSSDESRLFASTEGGTVYIWDTGTGAVSQYLGKPASNFVEWSEKIRIISAGASGTLDVWDLNRASLIATFSNQQRGLKIALTHEPPRIYSSGVDRAVRRWDGLPLEDLSSLETADDLVPYRTALAQEAPSSVVPPAELILVSRARLAEVLTRLREVVASQPVESYEQGIELTAGPTYNAVARLALIPSDRIVSLNGVGISSGEDALLAIDTGIEAAADAEVAMTLVRCGQELTARCLFVPVVNEEVERTYSPSEMRDNIERMADSIRRNASTAYVLSQDRATAAGNPLATARDLDGLVLSFLSEGDDAGERYAAVGLTDDDRIIALNGSPVTNIDTFLDQLDGLLQQLADGEAVSLVFDVERGGFRTLTVTLNTNP